MGLEAKQKQERNEGSNTDVSIANQVELSIPNLILLIFLRRTQKNKIIKSLFLIWNHAFSMLKKVFISGLFFLVELFCDAFLDPQTLSLK